MSSTRTSPSTTTNIIHSLALGGFATVVTAPIINVFNCASVVAARYNVTGKNLFNVIYSGKYYPPHVPGWQNSLEGLRPHLVKELTRLGFKAPGLGVYQPWLETIFSAHQATQIYAISMSAMEFIINPADTWRVVRQSGGTLSTSLRALYKGALLNSVRQYIIWATVGYNNMLFNPIMRAYGIDPDSAFGIALKAYPQATINIASSYVIERVKNELQFNKLLVNKGAVEAAEFIYRTQGKIGFFRGLLIKTPGGAVQHAAALSVMAWGKKRRAAQEQEAQNNPSSVRKKL